MKSLGYGDAYQYSHNGAGNFAYQEFMPDALSGTRFYDPGDNPLEAKIRERLRNWWQEKYDY
jgi:putative ATPase